MYSEGFRENKKQIKKLNRLDRKFENENGCLISQQDLRDRGNRFLFLLFIYQFGEVDYPIFWVEPTEYQWYNKWDSSRRI